MGIAAGWYEDGVTAGSERWFDGTAWTGHTRPVAGPAPVAGYAPFAPPGPAVAPSLPGYGPAPASPSPVPAYAPYAPGPYAAPAGYGAYPAPAGYGAYPPPTGYSTPPPYGAQLGQAPGGLDSGPGSALHWLVPVGRSWQSIVAGYVGLVGLFVWVLAPVAIGLGVWALRVARNGGHGTGRAVFAIVAGVAGSAFGLLFLTL